MLLVFVVLIKLTLVTGGWPRSTRCRPFLALGACRTDRAGWTSFISGSVCTHCVCCLSDAVPWVTRHHRSWRCSSLTPFFPISLVIFVVVVLERVGGLGGRAGSGALPFERGQRACVWRCCQSSRGRGRGWCFLLLGFWLNQCEPRWVFGFMGATEQWNTDSDGGEGHTEEDNKVHPHGSMEG